MLNKKAFTLVELIVVIAILAILSTIAFISLQGYSKNARDTARISDIGSMKKVLELYKISSEKYPNPTGGEAVTYSGSEVWTQGTFGESVLKEVKKISNIPIDPLTDSEYTYSVLNTDKEYELGTIFEGDLSKLDLQTTKAGNTISKAYISGTYNGVVAKVNTGSTTYVLAVPTIINSDLSEKDLATLVSTNKLVYNGGSNLPGSYTGTTLKLDGGIDKIVVNSGDLVVFSGNISDIDTPEEKRLFIKNIQKAYSGTYVSGETAIKNILSADSTNTSTVVSNLAGNIINNSLDGSVVIEESVSTITNEGNFTIPINGLIAEYLFNDSANLAKDNIGNHTGTNSGAIQVTGINGGKAAVFPESELNDSGFISTNYTLQDNSTISFWYKKDGSLNSTIPIGIYTDDMNRGYVTLNRDNEEGSILAGYRDNGTWILTNKLTNTYNTQNEWNYFTFKFVGNNIDVFVNGDNVGALEGHGFSYGSEFGINFGDLSNDGGPGFSIDNLRIYNRTLSQSEITQLYAEGLSNPSASLPFIYGSENPSNHFSTFTYSGNNGDQNIVSNLDMSSGDNGGFVWVKNRTLAEHHILQDTVRGESNALITSSTNSELTGRIENIKSWNTNGVTIGNDQNISGNNYVSWNWRTTNKTSGLTSGLKNYTSHYNPTAGFSIIGYQGDFTQGHKVPHHLNKKPELLIIKNRGNSSVSWHVITGDSTSLGENNFDVTNSDGTGYRALLQLDSAFGTSYVMDGQTNYSDNNYIAYAFHSVPGYSKIGTYNGTGVSGNKIDLGFKPAYVMIKRMDITGSWYIFDNQRTDNKALYANVENVEYDGGANHYLNFISDGFDFDTVSVNHPGISELGGEYLYYAISE